MQGPEVAGRQDLLTLLEAADLAFGAYKRNPQSLCAVTSLPVGALTMRALSTAACTGGQTPVASCLRSLPLRQCLFATPVAHMHLLEDDSCHHCKCCTYCDMGTS
jgi:hypothetical protein